ncbi:PDZ domain-containing protein [Novosphingobium sp. KCTC 2891]|uniref:type II secretion system protein N n=1 Tax=Novosphingobium sp. KCTC 2891 TaxID=2989730 RepID=UPI002222DE46|nr:type II secretion system protein N [Novosphingobium sp. KCTC 2891]MCW1384026.1 PDZ domain-containing protein [Novosphingobium sp. KCTC 2891]
MIRRGAMIGARRAALPHGLTLHAMLWWTLAATIASLGAAILWALVTPVSPIGAWRPATVRIPSPAERAALFASVDPFNRGAASSAGPASSDTGAVTSLALTLFATRSTPGGGGSAIIAGAGGVQQVVRTGSEVQPGVTLAAVAFDHVVLSRNGARELLYLDQSGDAPSADRVVAANPVRDTLAPASAAGPLTVDAARRGIGFGPRAEGGRVTGLEVMPSGDGKVFRAAGFQPGDVITAVDGKPVSGAGDGALLAGALRPGASVSVTVRRGDRQLPLAITLAP